MIDDIIPIADIKTLALVLKLRRQVIDLEAEIKRRDRADYIMPDSHAHWKRVHAEYIDELNRLGF